MKYAVIKTGGKQYKVSEGQTIVVERITTPLNEEVTFADVLMFADDANIVFGAPVVAGVSVVGKVISHPRGEKIRVAKFKAKARYRRVMGHRQELSNVLISSISQGSTKKAAATK